ncbi:hypothetical protein QYE76_010759 [Lolium multiflorum]|uniref:Reverse transcriptase Ty1/copia-type domain-containing protein n=1 Tax=Lolium multiflorum TaxID=4521 RepID=A0AAD8TXV8_LOLMU|nr:hypothetical protein QYE76_010759 [Lolium multiflorum]
MPATPEYEINRLARIAKRKAEEAGHLANIRNIASQLNKWSDEENKKICATNKENQKAVKHHQTTCSMSYPSHFHQLKKDKYNNEDPSPIEFFKETNTNRKTGCMSATALEAYTDMEKRRSEAQQEDEHLVSGTHIVAEVLKEHNSSSTFLSTMGYQSTSETFRTSDSEERIRDASWESDPIHETPMESDEESDDESSDSDEDDNEAPTRSKRQRTAKSFGNDFIVYLVDDTPTTISEALASPDADYWKEAVQSEMDSILANGTWELTERPYGCKPVGCKWVFKKKLRADGTIEKYKARLVAKGYTQKEGEDFFDTYSPVARLTTIRVLLSLAASHGLLVHQMDVKTAFLNGELDEEIYMEQPMVSYLKVKKERCVN